MGAEVIFQGPKAVKGVRTFSRVVLAPSLPSFQNAVPFGYITSVLSAALTSRPDNDLSFCTAPGATGQRSVAVHANAPRQRSAPRASALGERDISIFRISYWGRNLCWDAIYTQQICSSEASTVLPQWISAPDWTGIEPNFEF